MSEEKKILCVGLCVLDIIHVCEKFPEEDSDKRCLQGYWQRGGNASNNCTVLRQFDCKCEFLGVLSKSDGFQFLESDCINRNIEIKNCPKISQDPPLSSVILSQETKSRTIIHSNPNFPILKYDDFKKINLNEYKWIHFEARNPIETLKMIEKIVEYNKSQTDKNIIKISIDFEKLREENFILAKYADIVFLGKDLAMYLGWSDLKSACHGFRSKIESSSGIICTWGSEGSGVLDQHDTFSKVDPYPPNLIVDSLGAGDTFCASSIFALSLNKPIFEAVTFASKITGKKLSFHGYDEISKFYKSFL